MSFTPLNLAEFNIPSDVFLDYIEYFDVPELDCSPLDSHSKPIKKIHVKANKFCGLRNKDFKKLKDLLKTYLVRHGKHDSIAYLKIPTIRISLLKLACFKRTFSPSEEDTPEDICAKKSILIDLIYLTKRNLDVIKQSTRMLQLFEYVLSLHV
jgi:hypothetical protein